LFEAGRQALAEGDYDLACQKFAESNRLERAAGTMLNLANCEEKRGRVATAWLRYTEAMDMMSPQDTRYEFAKNQAALVEARVPRLTIRLAKDAPVRVSITVNGQKWEEPLGTSARLDPLNYVLIVSAPDHESATFEVTLEEFDVKDIAVAPGEKIDEPPPEPADKKRLGFIVGGAGAGLAVIGLTFGVLAAVDYQTVKRDCDFDTNTCYTDKGNDAAARGGVFEVLAYGLGAVGVAGLSVGGYLLLHEKKGASTKLEVGQLGMTSGARLSTTF
jgi:hypothetical protein